MTLVLRIKKKWLDKIINGNKKIEYRKISPFYSARLKNNPNCVLFLCGKIKVKYELLKWEIVAKGDLGKFEKYAIYLGKEL